MTLEQQIREVLARLSMLSEAQAGRAPEQSPPKKREGERERVNPSERMPMRVGGGGSRAAESAIPAGARLDLEPHRPPPKDRSAYDWFRWQFERLDLDTEEGIERAERLVQLADIEYKARAVHSPRRRALRSGKLDSTTDDGDLIRAGGTWPAPAPLAPRGYNDDSERPNTAEEAEQAAAARIVEWYEGMSAVQVAFLENTTESWVRKARKSLSRDPDFGRERPPFLDWDHDERQRQVDMHRARARSEGREIGAKSLANHFGVDKNTIKRYLDRPAVAA